MGSSILRVSKLSLDAVDSFTKVASAPESNLASTVSVAWGCPRSHPSVFCFLACLIRVFKAFLIRLISSDTGLPVGEGVTAWVNDCEVIDTLGELGTGFVKCLGAQFVPGIV